MKYWIALGVVVAEAMYLLGVNSWTGIIGDNIVYIRDAQRLWAGLPMLDTQYGPGLKLILAPFSDSMVAMKSVVALTGLLIPLCGYFVLRRFMAPWDSLIVAMLASLLPITVEFSSEVMADVPYTAFSLLAIWMTLRWVEAPTIKLLAFAATAIGWAYYVKSPALLIPLCTIIWLVWNKRGREAWWMGGIMVAVLLSTMGGGYTQSVSTAIAKGENIANPTGFWSNLSHLIFVKNPVDYATNAGALFGVPYWQVGLVVIALVLVGLVNKLNSIPGLYLCGYVGVLFLLPGAPLRYLIPVMVFILAYGFMGVERIIPWTKQKLCVVPVVLCVSIFGVSLLADVELIKFRQEQIGYGGGWDSYYQAAIWVKKHTSPGAIIAARKPTLMWYWSGRESELYPWTEDPDKAWEEFQKFDYVVVDAIEAFPQTRKFLVPLLNEHMEDFRVVHISGPPPQAYILRRVK